jgi:hypothetical protein
MGGFQLHGMRHIDHTFVSVAVASSYADIRGMHRISHIFVLNVHNVRLFAAVNVPRIGCYCLLSIGDMLLYPYSKDPGYT